MPEMTTPRELFLHDLRDIYYVEKQLVQLLPKLAREATDAELERGFTKHHKETQRHVKNVEAAFKALGERASTEECPGFDGLKQEHDEFMQERPSASVRDMFLAAAAAKTEHYEISAYTSMVAMARALGEKRVVTLLEKNLADEKETLREADKVGRRLGREGAKEQKRPAATRRTTASLSTRSTGSRTRSTGGRSSGRTGSSASSSRRRSTARR
jgi:ferritin-like metal-binding protein YciE